MSRKAVQELHTVSPNPRLTRPMQCSLLPMSSPCPQSPSVPTLDPRTRCFSDLPAWLDEHAYDKLAGRTVLMYCTGGVRCERASAYLREMGPAFSNVYQLQGKGCAAAVVEAIKAIDD